MGEKVKSKETSNSPVKWNIVFFRKIFFATKNRPIFVVEIHPFSGFIFRRYFLKERFPVIGKSWMRMEN